MFINLLEFQLLALNASFLVIKKPRSTIIKEVRIEVYLSIYYLHDTLYCTRRTLSNAHRKLYARVNITHVIHFPPPFFIIQNYL